jgi:hypothetical protein
LEVWNVPVGAIGLRVEVAKGTRVERKGVGLIPAEVHEVRRRKKEERRTRKAEG